MMQRCIALLGVAAAMLDVPLALALCSECAGPLCSECDVPGDEVSLLAASAVMSRMRADDTSASSVKVPCNEIGQMRSILGEWTGTRGVSVTIMPSGDEELVPPSLGYVQNTTYPLYHQYDETWTFEPGAKAVNRGPLKSDVLWPIKYTHKALAPAPTGIIHSEIGFFLVKNTANANFGVAREGSVPHGASFMIFGNYSNPSVSDVESEQEELNGLERIKDRISIPDVMQEIEYATHKAFTFPSKGHQAQNLKFGDMLKDSRIDVLGSNYSPDNKVLKMDLGLMHGAGGIIQEPQLTDETPQDGLESTFWIFEDKDSGTQVMQYWQNVFFTFLSVRRRHEYETNLPEECKTLPLPVECTLSWPHLQIGTVTKTKEYTGCA